jgi:nitrogenase molybdenum-iron protein NifN
MLRELQSEKGQKEYPQLVSVSVPSYKGTHMYGYHEAMFQVVKTLAVKSKKVNRINFFSAFVSPEDIRHFKEILADFELPGMIFPDYSESLDQETWEQYERIPKGGTSIEELQGSGSAIASIQLGRFLGENSPASYLEKEFQVPGFTLGLPIGIKENDIFFETLKKISGREIPSKYEKQRGRLVDSYVDGHKTLFGKKAVIYGEEDLVYGLVSFLTEIGVEIAVAATGSKSSQFVQAIRALVPERFHEQMKIMDGADFQQIEKATRKAKADIALGNSKGYAFCRRLKLPLLRLGFPIHDRIGAQRIQHIGYQGTQRLYDQIVNLLLERKQTVSDVGYSYL